MAKKYEPRIDCAELRHAGVDLASGPDVSRWWIELSADSTIVELALLNVGLGCKLRVEHVGEGAFRLHPVDPDAPAPTAERIRDILAGGVGQIPNLFVVRM